MSNEQTYRAALEEIAHAQPETADSSTVIRIRDFACAALAATAAPAEQSAWIDWPTEPGYWWMRDGDSTKLVNIAASKVPGCLEAWDCPGISRFRLQGKSATRFQKVLLPAAPVAEQQSSRQQEQ